MIQGATSPHPALDGPCHESERSGSSPGLTSRILRIGCVAAAGLLLANCANDQVARRGKSKEIGAFPSSKYGPASPRVVRDGEPVPKGGGRQLVGRSYSVAGKRYTPYEKPVGYTIVGNASWYGEAFHGRRTANGEVYDRNSISAAHPTMPLPAYARVSNVVNGRSIIVRVNDRGPYHGNRVMDLSQRAADALAFRHLGTARVKIEYLGQASLAGSDDAMLLASLRTDGAPASIPGQSTRTLVASADPVAVGRSRSANLDEDQGSTRFQAAEPTVELAPAPQRAASRPVPAPVVAAPEPAAEPVRRVVQPSAPVAASLVAAPVAAMPMKGVRLPPERPFDLDTIAGAGKPVAFGPRKAASPLPPLRGTSVASLYAAQEQLPPPRFDRNHPLGGKLASPALVPLARN